MKTIGKISAMLLFSMAIVSCSNSPDGEKSEATSAKKVKNTTEGAMDYTLNAKRSLIQWEGTKPGGSHNGTIDIKDGSFRVEDDQIVGGKFTIDMNSIKNKDLQDPEKITKLVGHLKSADFFDVEKFPTATFEITNIKEAKPTGDFKTTHTITGNLTMKGNTKSISFPAQVEFVGNFIKAQSNNFVIDRSKWNVRYGSRSFFDNLKNKYINDDIALRIRITAEE